MDLQQAQAIREATDYATLHEDQFVQELCEFLKIPSISALADYRKDVHRAANFVKEALLKAGIPQVTVEQTAGHPIVCGELHVGNHLPTVLLYGHYDVQPVDPLDLWSHPPFEPTVKKERLYARGASDDKGQLYLHIKALESILKTQKTLPVNLKILIEGEEEIGSVNLTPFLKKHKRRLKSDIVLISDTEMAGKNQPALTYSLRGLVYFEVEVQTGTRDLHSGMSGGAVLNAAQVLMHALSQLQNSATGRFNIDTFYKDVTPLPLKEKINLRKLSLKEQSFKKALGVKSFSYEKNQAGGKTVNRFFERTTAEPSLEISGFVSGYTGMGAKTIIPARAQAKVGIRLVEHQNPKHILSCVKAQIRENLAKNIPLGLKSIELKFTDFAASPSVCTERDSSAMQAASRALEEVYKKTPVMLRSGGSIPIVADFVEVLQAEAVLMGFGLREDAIHSPNESFALKDFSRGLHSSIRFLHYLT